MNGAAWIVRSLLELVYPQGCALCGSEHGEKPWVRRGEAVEGLRFWDGTHLCLACASGLGSGHVSGLVGTGPDRRWPVVAAVPTSGGLVKLVSLFKYHGVRGLAWPLARMLREPRATACGKWGDVDALVPVALHRRRQRMRGFNQAEILARLLAWGTKTPVLTDVLVRHRNTGQQAKLSSSAERRENLKSSFAVRHVAGFHPRSSPALARIGLVDDLVTSGWTAVWAAEALRSAGWDVKWVLAVGLAAESKKSRPRVDTWEGGF